MSESTHEVILPLFQTKPEKRYRTLVADPPWNFDDHLGEGPKGASAHYPTMTLAELSMLPVGGWALDDSCLYLWTVNAFIVQAHSLAKAWGFIPRTIITWVKGRIEANHLIQQIGLGHFYRNTTEHILFCVRGSINVMDHAMPTAFLAPKGGHSEKPDTFYDIVERMSPGPYLDVFSRKQRFNWDTWGNEAFDFRTHSVWG